MLTKRERRAKRVLNTLVVIAILCALISAFAQPQAYARRYSSSQGGSNTKLEIGLMNGCAEFSFDRNRVIDGGGSSYFAYGFTDRERRPRVATWLLPTWDRDALRVPLIPLATLLCLTSRHTARWLGSTPVQEECPYCGYSLADLPSPTCPECGAEHG